MRTITIRVDTTLDIDDVAEIVRNVGGEIQSGFTSGIFPPEYTWESE